MLTRNKDKRFQPGSEVITRDGRLDNDASRSADIDQVTNHQGRSRKSTNGDTISSLSKKKKDINEQISAISRELGDPYLSTDLKDVYQSKLNELRQKRKYFSPFKSKSTIQQRSTGNREECKIHFVSSFLGCFIVIIIIFY